MNSSGKVIWQAPHFEEGLFVVEPSGQAKETAATDDYAMVHEAVRMAIRDYVHKTGFSRVVIGLSGGIDSSVVAAISAEALGPENVLGVTMPSKVSSKSSSEDAKKLASNIGIKVETVPIGPLVDAYGGVLDEHFAAGHKDLAEENLQARIRGNILMGFANAMDLLVLCPGNRSEALTGYATLYGDMAGAYAPISDIPKTSVYKLAEKINERAGKDVIPRSIIEKEPTAELKEGQTDTEALGSYDVLDRVLHEYVDNNLSFDDIVQK